MNETQIRDRATRIQELLERAAVKSGRSHADVTVLPVTKGHPAALLPVVASLGFGSIGENRVSEAESKQGELGRLGLKWHMIGHLQRNKASRAVQVFDVIESVDSLRLARRLQLDAERLSRDVVEVLIQVNAGGEEQKSGVEPERAVEDVGPMLELDRLRLTGLMTMAPYSSDEAILRRTFVRARECLERLQEELPDFRGRTLSMGMSNDFEIAVEEGSTEVRLGTALLGERPEG